jgi:hypothetical protein
VLKHQALPLLRDSIISDEFKKDIEHLIKALEGFEDIEENIVPENSLLREFLGN